MASGCLILALNTNHLALFIGVLGFVVYIFFYTFGKRYTTWGTEIGSIAGATPPLAGYLAVSNKLDAGAIILYLIFVLWQMPHFYAIAIYRLKEYKQAGIPVLPAIKGIYRTKINMLVYIISFIIALSLLTKHISACTNWVGIPFNDIGRPLVVNVVTQFSQVCYRCITLCRSRFRCFSQTRMQR